MKNSTKKSARKKTQKVVVIDRNSRPLTGETRTWGELDDAARKKGFSLAESIARLGGPRVRLSARSKTKAAE